MKSYIAVIGSGDDGAPEEEAAQEAGRLLATAGAVVVCGGLGGVMRAACRGAHEAGGLTIGILPGEDRRTANEFVEIAIPTGLGEARNLIVVRAADGVLAIGGGYGTLSEIGFALRLGKPLVAVGSWDLPPADIGRASDVRAGVEMIFGMLAI